MVLAIEIATAVHKMCEKDLIPRKISPPHGISMHESTSGYYADKLNSAGMTHVTGEQVIQAIIQASGWDGESSWPGHPVVEKVIKVLNQVELLETSS